MRALVVTEKHDPEPAQHDGGARLVESLRRHLSGRLEILQFDRNDGVGKSDAMWRYRYPKTDGDRFGRRIDNADFIAARVREVAHRFTHVLFVHVSMQFGFTRAPLSGPRTITFPMFLTSSYLAANERVPPSYRELERQTLSSTDRVLTPSHLERRQLLSEYGVPEQRVRVVPRGIEVELLTPRRRALAGKPLFCSVGSVKRQKNTVGLVGLFHAVRRRHPTARLHIIGPVQDVDYARQLKLEIERLGLSDAVDLLGHVPPARLASVLSDVHVNLSASHCETFGRAIFETLASGIPNVVPASGNAAAEYLEGRPYARFYHDMGSALEAVDSILANYGPLSEAALEVGAQFDDARAGRLLVEEIVRTESELIEERVEMRGPEGRVPHGGES